MINSQACSNDLCPGDAPQTCCSATQISPTNVQARCCAQGQICCGQTGLCCNQGESCCSDRFCIGQGQTCCGNGYCKADTTCCGGLLCCGQGLSCSTGDSSAACSNGNSCYSIGPANLCSSWSGNCFSGDDFVLLQNGLEKSLKDLRSGDKVYSINKQGEIVKDEIIMMLHGGSQTNVLFYEIIISSNQSISLTGDHLIMTYNIEEKRSILIAANELKVNDFILITDNNYKFLNPVRIISIEVLYKTGFYTPMTYTGTLLVNGIATSCYVKHQNTYNEMHILLYPFRLYYYLIKDILQLNDEPYSIEMRVNIENEENEFYGTKLIKNLHQSKKIIKYIVQDLLLHTILNI